MNKKILDEKTDDLLENLKFLSQNTFLNEEQKPQLKLFKQSENLNYKEKVKTEETILETNQATETLNLLTHYIKTHHGQRPQEVNYFLDDTPQEILQKPINEAQFNRKQNLQGVCLRDTWSKGHQFFYIDQGTTVRIINIKEGYATIEFEYKKGIIHVNDLQIL